MLQRVEHHSLHREEHSSLITVGLSLNERDKIVLLILLVGQQVKENLSFFRIAVLRDPLIERLFVNEDGSGVFTEVRQV